MKRLSIIIIALAGVFSLRAQQLPVATFFQDLQYVWNPGFVAFNERADVGAFYKKQWVGFENAPNTAFVGLQYPFTDLNMSASIGILADNAGSLTQQGIHLSYNYKLRQFFKEDDFLSVGIQGFFHQFKLDPTDEVILVPDPSIQMMSQTAFTPSFGVGLAYKSYVEEFAGENIFYFGVSMLQLLERESIFDQDVIAPRQQHYFLNAGYKFYGLDYAIEPIVQVNYIDTDINYVNLGFKYELEETFWAGLSYSSVNDISINGGVILNDVGRRSSFVKIGAIAGINMGQSFNAGPGFEFYMSYNFEAN